MIHAAARDSLDQVRMLEGFFGTLVPATDSNLVDAKQVLSTGYLAFLHAEAALNYPETAPVWSQPLGGALARHPTTETPGFARIARLIDDYSTSPLQAGGGGHSKAVVLDSLRLETSALRASLEAFVASWNPDMPGNFRSQSFLVDVPSAIGKILDGLLSETDLLIQDQAAPVSPERLVGRLEGVKTIFTGRYDTLQFKTLWSPGLGVLVQKSDPSAARAIEGTVDMVLDSSKKAGGLNDSKTAASLRDLKRQILAAGEVLGYSFEPTQP